MDMIVYWYDLEPLDAFTTNYRWILTMPHAATRNSLIKNVWWYMDIIDLSILDEFCFVSKVE